MEKAKMQAVCLLLARLLCATALFVGGAKCAIAARYSEDQLCIDNGDRRIVGVMATPESAVGRMPVAIFAHGFNGSMDYARAYFDTLCSMGYRCYAFDFPCGAKGSRSGGSTVDMSVMDETADVEAVVRHFRSRSDVDTSAIALIGESQGGLVAALAAANMPENVSRLVLIYPAFCIPDDWNGQYPAPADIPDTTMVWNVPVGARFFRELRGLNVFGTIGRYGRPVLLLHGDKDAVVPPDYSRRAATVYRDATLHTVYGAGHGFSGRALTEAVGHVADFLLPLRMVFERPPHDARPLMIWEWMDGVVSADGITADLEAYREAGIGGVQQFLVGGPMQVEMRDTANAIGTDNWRRLMRHAISECRRLDLSFGTHNCPGWSSSGFPAVTPEYSMQKLVWRDTVVAIGRKAATVELRRPEVDSAYDFYRDVTVVAVPADSIGDPGEVVDLTEAFDSVTACVRAELPRGRWRLMRFGHTTNGKTNASTAPYGGVGLECDKMSREAVRRYWETYPQMLLDIAGDDAGTTFCRMEIDSYEAGGQDWTPLMPEEFRSRCGYELLPWLPALAGLTVGDEAQTKRFVADFRKTVTTLFAENYYSYMAELAHGAGGIRLLYQPYGTGSAKPFNPISTSGIASRLPDDYFCTEFWLNPERWGWPSVPNHVAVAHRYGLRRIYAEGFTSWALAAWQETPEDLKRMADRAFCLGINALMLHAGAQNPWPGALPGMSFGKWGAWWTPGQTWWRSGAARLLFEYYTRCQALLQRGYYVDDYTCEAKSLATNAAGLQWIHRRDGDVDMYFVANRLDSAFTAEVTVPGSGRQTELWNPETGRIETLKRWTDDDTTTTMTLHFDESQSLFIVCGLPASPADEPRSLSDSPDISPVTVSRTVVEGPWTLRFPDGWDAPTEVRMDSLTEWNESEDAGIRYFSGTATYVKDLRIDSPKDGHRYVLDLGRVANTARVVVNGRECAHLWKKPFRCDITDFVAEGSNHIEIEVTNLWPNRMIGDEQYPDDVEWGEPFVYEYAPGSPVIGRPMKSVPDWLANGKPRPSQHRKAVVSFKFYEKDDPLLPSGLLGPVALEVVEP